MRLFFFGTLMDPEVRAIVMGRQLPADAVEPAVVQGFRRVFVAGRHYPMLLAHASGWVDGTLVSGLDAETVHRLQVYEGWEYTLTPLRVRTASGQTVLAQVFMCPPHVAADRRPWKLTEWQRRHKRGFLPRAELLMRRHGQRPALAPPVSRKKR